MAFRSCKNRKSGLVTALFFALATTVATAYDIRDFGALPFDDSLYAEQTNAQAFMDCIVAANYTADKTVVVPWNHTFHMMPVWAGNFTNITITIDGVIKASKRHRHYPIFHNDKVRDLFYFGDTENVKIQGNGTVDGQGYMWWAREFVSQNHHGRPRLLFMEWANNTEVTGVKWLNAPHFNLELKDMDTLWVHDFEIFADYKGQMELGKFFNKTLPMFPLNTDGVDPHGRNILIERLNITNYDDAVAIKPCHKNYTHVKCSENIIVRDCTVYYGVGMTIGTVKADDEYNCIKNVTFSNHTFYHPLKAVYVKTNPGTTNSSLPGSGGIISDITYENLEIHHPLWWSIYIGPQQQNQPGRGHESDPGCLLYPLVPCETQPLVDVKNITLRNVNQYGTLLPPGVIRCNETNPCTGFVFDNVKAHGWWRIFGKNYIVEHVEGQVIDSKPIPAFTNLAQQDDEEKYQVQFRTMIEVVANEVVQTMLGGVESSAMPQRGSVKAFKSAETTFAKVLNFFKN